MKEHKYGICTILGHITELIGILAFASTQNPNYLLVTIVGLALYVYSLKKGFEKTIEEIRTEINEVQAEIEAKIEDEIEGIEEEMDEIRDENED